MYQEPTRRLPNLSERCHVRKIARLLAQPLRQSSQDEVRIGRSFAELPSRILGGSFFEHYGYRPLEGGIKTPMTSNMLPLKKCIELLLIVKPREGLSPVGVPFLASVDQVFVKRVYIDPTIGMMLLHFIDFSPTHLIVGHDPRTKLLSHHFPIYRLALFRC